MRLTFDNVAFSELQEQRQQSGDAAFPKRWHCVIDELAMEVLGRRVERFRIADLVDPRTRAFCWHPTNEAILSAGSGRLIFLSWGVSWARQWKAVFGHLIFRRASTLIANESVTASEIQSFVARRVEVLPFYIDPHFWSFSDRSSRSDFLFCPGYNDRNGELLERLVALGHRVVWNIHHPDVALIEKRYSTVKVVRNLSYPELRRLYQSCRAVVQPLVQDRHAAGQTTTMEAIACGAPVFLSEGRTATIFEHLPSVTRVASADEWERCDFSAASGMEDSARWIRDDHIPRCINGLRSVISNATIY